MNSDKSNCCIITVNYNSYSFTKKLLFSLRMSDCKTDTLYIIDNFSLDESYSKIFSLLTLNNKNKVNFPNSKISTCYKINNIYLVRLQKNYGYASAINIALEINKQNNKNLYYWVVNNDIEVEFNTLEILKEQYTTNSIITPVVYDLNNKHRIQSLGCKIDPYFLTTKNITSIRSLHKTKIDYLSGVSLFFDNNVLNKVGLFSENYFMYYEDVDWCIRALNEDVKLKINLNTKIFHNYKKNINFKLKIHYLLNRLRLAFRFYKSKIPLVFLYTILSLLFNLFRYSFIIKNVK